MNRLPAILTLLFVLAASVFEPLSAQSLREIEGRVWDDATNEGVPFANIYNKTLGKGTISNIDGFFRIQVASVADSVKISSIGYEDQFMRVSGGEQFYTVVLKSNVQMLDDFVVKPRDNSYLATLLRDCRKNNAQKRTSKAYYELKSYIADQQVELVEGYYNLGINGYKVNDLNMKAGRIALREYGDHFFASLESSKAVLMFDLFGENDYFPASPLELSGSKLRKSFYLTLESQYVNNGDSIYVIGFRPKDTTGKFFEGTAWVNQTKKLLVKIDMQCANTGEHPFLPMFPNDTISGVSLHITQTFREMNGASVFNHTDFSYGTTYKSRLRTEDVPEYTVQTKAILYAYDYSRPFTLPEFKFSEPSTGDYRRINALPYNTFFWKFNDEYRLNDSVNSNERFFSDPRSMTSSELFRTNAFTGRALFEHPFVRWSKNRIVLREVIADTTLDARAPGFKSEQYNLAVKIFLDVNAYAGTLNVLTAAVIDPFETYYRLPMDRQTHCFINMYFDLCEIERRRLEDKLLSEQPAPGSIPAIYSAFSKEFDAMTAAYLNAVQRGTDEKAMTRYNAIVYEKLGIDNLAIYQPFPPK